MPAPGRVLYGVLSFGGFLGMGDKLFAIPWRSLRLTDDAKEFVLNVEKDRLKNATGFAKDRWPDFANEQFATSTYQYYDEKPYWESKTGDVQLAADREGETTASHRDRWNQRAAAWQKCSDLCGKEVRTAQTDDVGKLDDLVVDPDSGRVLYGILSYRGRLFAIPWNVLTLNTNAEQLVLNADEKQLSDNFSFDKDNWPNLVDQGWRRTCTRITTPSRTGPSKPSSAARRILQGRVSQTDTRTRPPGLPVRGGGNRLPEALSSSA